MITVTNRIGELRRQKGLTQAQLASMTKLSSNFISLIEKGKKTPSLRSLSEIAKALNVSTASLIGDDLRTEMRDLKSRYNVTELMEAFRELIEDATPVICHGKVTKGVKKTR